MLFELLEDLDQLSNCARVQEAVGVINYDDLASLALKNNIKKR